MNAGELQINITNHGLIGSQYTDVSTYADAPSAQWPAGSGIEYLWSAGFWVGGVYLAQRLVSTGQYEREFRPRPHLEDTIYEAIDGEITRPAGNLAAGGVRSYLPGGDDDGDGSVDEEVLNGYDDDGDFLIDEDFGQIADQMMVCTMYDNTPLAQQEFPDHVPMNLRVVQKSFAWDHVDAEDFVGFEFKVTNVGAGEISDVYLGLFADCDIGRRGTASPGQDDLAGFWEGFVRATDGTFVPVGVAYMYDGAVHDPVPGYFGILFLDYTRGDPSLDQGPSRIRARSYQNFTGHTAFQQGGDPTCDTERYDVLSRSRRDPDTPADRPNDIRFLISAGPWQNLNPQQTLTIRAAMVVGEGLDGLLRNCAEAGIACYGKYFNLDSGVGDGELRSWETGVRGRETKVCKDEFPTMPNGQSALFSHIADFWDTSCTAPMSGFPITRDDLFVDADGRLCIFVNMDNCFECERRAGRECTPFTSDWARYSCAYYFFTNAPGCTGVAGRETHVPWLYFGYSPPPAPGIRLWPRDHSVHVFWDDRSQHTPDAHTGEIDFESYRIWRVTDWDRPPGTSEEQGPETRLWELIAEYDVVNDFYVEHQTHQGTFIDTLALGPNTGFEEVAYRPICLDDPRFAGLAAAMQEVIDGDPENTYLERPRLRDRYGNVRPGLEGLLPWEGYPAVLDTFFLVTPRQEDTEQDIVGKRAVAFYEYVDRGLHNGFLYFYSVTATDHLIDEGRIVGPGYAGDPGETFETIRPGTPAQTAEHRQKYGANIYVYPNPASLESLADFQPMSPTADDPTGVRVMFANLPQAVNTITIFSLDGDLLVEIPHDGTSGHGEVSWNLVTRHGQQVVSGIYLYVVQSDDPRFEDFLGKFVVIR